MDIHPVLNLTSPSGKVTRVFNKAFERAVGDELVRIHTRLMKFMTEGPADGLRNQRYYTDILNSKDSVANRIREISRLKSSWSFPTRRARETRLRKLEKLGERVVLRLNFCSELLNEIEQSKFGGITESELNDELEELCKEQEELHPIRDLNKTTRSNYEYPGDDHQQSHCLSDTASQENVSLWHGGGIESVIHSPVVDSSLRHRVAHMSRTLPKAIHPEPIIEQSTTNHKPKPIWQRGCTYILTAFLTFVLLSCFLGVYFTTKKELGYSMGDAFTLAGYVIAVGAFVSTALVAYHYPHCKCWKRFEKGKRVELEVLVGDGE